MMFDTGRVVMTSGVAELYKKDEIFAAHVAHSWMRYMKCDWGELDKSDYQLNDSAVMNYDNRILASYGKNNYKIWIITEWDRSATTILFPSEY